MFHVPLGALFSADAVSSCVHVWLGKAFWTFELMDSIDSIVMQRSWHRSKVLKSPGTIFEYFRMILQNTSAIFSLSFLSSFEEESCSVADVAVGSYLLYVWTSA